MTHEHLKSFIESAYEHAGDISPKTKGVVRDAVEETLDLLDKGEARVAEKIDGDWVVNQWLKKAILLSFRLNDPHKVDGGPAGGACGSNRHDRSGCGHRVSLYRFEPGADRRCRGHH